MDTGAVDSRDLHELSAAVLGVDDDRVDGRVEPPLRGRLAGTRLAWE
jgi:hypothetical protein